jgi:hypothetical protein
MAVPKENAKVTKTADEFMLPEMAKDITEAMIGPTQGVHTSPKLPPVKSPPQNPESLFPGDIWGINREKSCSRAD